MRAASLCILSFALLAGPAVAASVTAPDAARTGTSAGQVPPPLVAWTFERARGIPVAGQGLVFTLADPVGIDAAVNPQARGIHLVALRTSDGLVAWERELVTTQERTVAFNQDHPFGMSPPTVAGTALILQDTSGSVWSVNAATGEVTWHVDFGGDLGIPTDTPPLVVGSRLYAFSIAANDPSNVEPALQAIDLATHTVAWSKPAVWRNREYPVTVPPLSSDGAHLYTVMPPWAVQGTAAVAFTMEGTTEWVTPLAADRDWSGPVAAEGRLLLAGRGNDGRGSCGLGNQTLDVVSLNAASGAEQWRRSDTEPSPCLALAAGAPSVNGPRLAVGNIHRVMVVATDGQLQWQTELPGFVAGSPRFVCDTLVASSTFDPSAAPATQTSQVKVFEARTGALLWSAGSSLGTYNPPAETFGIDGLLVGTFPFAWATDEGSKVGLIAFGTDKVPPRWVPGRSLETSWSSRDHGTLVRGSLIDLNLDGVRVESSDRAGGPWGKVGWVPYVPFEPAARLWDLPPPTIKPVYYREVPVDKAGLEGPPSEVVNYTTPDWLLPEPPSRTVVTLDSPAANSTVSGMVELRGRTYWRGNGTPRVTQLQVMVQPPPLDGGQRPPFGAVVLSNGTWSAKFDSTTIPQGSGQELWPDGLAHVQVLGLDSDARLETDLKTGNGFYANIQALNVTTSSQHVIEGDPIDVTVNVTVVSGMHPDLARLTFGWPLVSPTQQDGVPHEVGAGVGVPATIQVLREEKGVTRFLLTCKTTLYTTHWPQNSVVKVGLRLEKAGLGFEAPTTSFPVTVQPDANATQRAAAIEQARRPAAQPYPPAVKEVALGAGAVGVLGVAAILGTEAGRFALLRAAGATALFTRIRGNAALDNRRREQLFLLVEGRPGILFRDLGELAGVHGGVLVHHLSTLEREGLVLRQRVGTRLHFYPAGTAPAPVLQLPQIQGRLLSLVRKGPVSQAEAARQLGVSRQALHYHVNALHDLGLLTWKRQGREAPLSLAEGAAAKLWTCPSCRALLLGGGAAGGTCPSCGAAARAGASRHGPTA